MKTQLDTKRIVTYLIISFGFTYLMSLVIYLTGGIVDSPEIVPGTGIQLYLVLLVVAMFGPLLGHIGTRLLTRDGWQGMGLRPNLRQGWRYWLLMWVLPPLLIAVGAGIYYLVFPQHFDPNATLMRDQLAAAAPGTESQVWLIMAAQIGAAFFIGPIINLLPMLGEEFGWRAYLQPKLLPLGERKMMVVMGVIWGLWHAPIIGMGYNYGFDYPGAPWSGILLFCWFTFVAGTLLGWATLRGKSVWPAVIGHGMINGFGGIVAVFTQGTPNSLIGPATVGIVGSAGFTLVALWIFFFKLKSEPVEEWPFATQEPVPQP